MKVNILRFLKKPRHLNRQRFSRATRANFLACLFLGLLLVPLNGNDAPSVPARVLQPRIVQDPRTDQNSFELTYTRSTNTISVLDVIEFSDDLINWAPVDPVDCEPIMVLDDPTSGRRTITVLLHLGESPPAVQFFRVREASAADANALGQSVPENTGLPATLQESPPTGQGTNEAGADPSGPLFLGTCPPVSGSKASLQITSNPDSPDPSKRLLDWYSDDKICGTFQGYISVGSASVQQWRYFPGNPARLVFVIKTASTSLYGDVLFEPYNRAVMDLVIDSKRIRYLLTVPTADLDIDANYDGKISEFAPDDPLEVSQGGLVAITNPIATNPTEIILRQLQPSWWDGYLTLTKAKNGDKIRVFDAATNGTEITFNGTDNRFANRTLPKSLWIQGEKVSDSPRDIELVFSAGSGVVSDTNTLTAVKVEIQVNNTAVTNDDVVQVKCDHTVFRATNHCQVRIVGTPSSSIAVNLTNPDGRLRFPVDATRMLTLPKDGSFVPFDISGESASAAIGDAKIRADISGKAFGEASVTVFSFDDAKLTLTPKGGYGTIDTATKRILMNTNGPSISYAASARLRPAGIDCTLPQTQDLEVSVAQNINFTDAEVYDTPSITWDPAATKGTTVTVPSTITITISSGGMVNDSDAASDPLYDNGTLFPNIRQKPVGCTGAVDATGDDSPNSWVLLTMTIPATDGVATVGTVTYHLNRLTSDNSFISWCVIYNAPTKAMCAIWEGTWMCKMSSVTGGAPTAGTSGTVSTNPKSGTPFANAIANDPTKQVTSTAGTTTFTK